MVVVRQSKKVRTNVANAGRRHCTVQVKYMRVVVGMYAIRFIREMAFGTNALKSKTKDYHSTVANETTAREQWSDYFKRSRG